MSLCPKRGWILLADTNQAFNKMLLDTETSVNVKQSQEIERFLHHILGTPSMSASYWLLHVACNLPTYGVKLFGAGSKALRLKQTHARVIFRVVTSTAADARFTRSARGLVDYHACTLLVVSGLDATSVHIYSSSEAGHRTSCTQNTPRTTHTHMQHGFVSASIRFSMQWKRHTVLV